MQNAECTMQNAWAGLLFSREAREDREGNLTRRRGEAEGAEKGNTRVCSRLTAFARGGPPAGAASKRSFRFQNNGEAVEAVALVFPLCQSYFASEALAIFPLKKSPVFQEYTKL